MQFVSMDEPKNQEGALTATRKFSCKRSALAVKQTTQHNITVSYFYQHVVVCKHCMFQSLQHHTYCLVIRALVFTMRSSAVLIHTQRCTKWEIGRLQEGLLKKEGSRINASRLSDVLLLKNLAAGGESCTQNLLKQVIKECSLREEARITREEQMAASQGSFYVLAHM